MELAGVVTVGTNAATNVTLNAAVAANICQFAAYDGGTYDRAQYVFIVNNFSGGPAFEFNGNWFNIN